MAGFSFRLQPVLNVKRQMEDNIKNELGKAIQKLEAEKRVLAQLNAELDNIVAEFNSKTKKVTVCRLVALNGYLALLNSRIKLQKVNVNKASLHVDKIREELLEAVKERKVFEKLKERKYEQFMAEFKAQEQKSTDEVASYGRRDGNTGESA